jgi:hypothetical protein
VPPKKEKEMERRESHCHLADVTILYVENPQVSIKRKLLELINEFS